MKAEQGQYKQISTFQDPAQTPIFGRWVSAGLPTDGPANGTRRSAHVALVQRLSLSIHAHTPHRLVVISRAKKRRKESVTEAVRCCKDTSDLVQNRHCAPLYYPRLETLLQSAWSIASREISPSSAIGGPTRSAFSDLPLATAGRLPPDVYVNVNGRVSAFVCTLCFLTPVQSMR